MTKDQKAAINEGIEALGGITKTAALFDVTVPNVQHWRTRGVPTRHIKKFVEETRVSGKRLRPDLYG